MTVFARTGDANGFCLAWMGSSVLVTGPVVGFLTGIWYFGRDGSRVDLFAIAVTAGAVLAYVLYSARWLRFTPERLIVVRPWLVRRVSWERVGHCAFELGYLRLWTCRSGRQEGGMLKLLRADPPARLAPGLTPAETTRSERRLSAVLAALHRRGVRLDPAALVWAAIDELEGDDEAAPVDAAAEELRERELEALAAAETGIVLVDAEEATGLFYRPVPLDEVRDVRALWQRAGSDPPGAGP
ncbi:MAG: hypothetical protein ACR2ML_03245 [Solirubrobacteraceae bacterium]